MLKFINFFLFGLVVITLGLGVFAGVVNPHKITQEVLDLFPHTEDREIIDIYHKFSDSHYIVVAVKGFEATSRENLESFLAEVNKLPNIHSTLTKKSSKALSDFLARHYFAFASPKEPLKSLSPKDIKQTLLNHFQSLQANIHSIENVQDFAHIGFNPIDPLNLFALHSFDNESLVIDNYGYMALVEMISLEEKKVEQTLQSFKDIAKHYPQIRYFSQNFMNVENLGLILSEVNFLLGFASLVFIVLYFVIIRIPILTLNTICTLLVSNIIAIFVVSTVYPKVTIMALSFGMGISNIAIDYMMHHNFFSLYATRKPVFNKPVFYGYITTIVGFSACLFIPFPLLTQLSLYAIISLTLSYISFAFLYPRIGFNKPRFYLKMSNLRFFAIKSWWFLLVSVILGIFIALNIRFDFDLSKLDYQNEAMLKERDFFEKTINSVNVQILLSSSKIDDLITFAKALQNRINASSEETFIPLSILPNMAQVTENRAFLESPQMQQNKATLKAILPQLKSHFLNHLTSNSTQTALIKSLFATLEKSYEMPPFEAFDIENINNIGLNIIENNGRFYYMAKVNALDLSIVEEYAARDILNRGIDAHIETRSLESLLDHIADDVYQPMLVILGIALVLMISTLFFTAREAFLDSVVFIIFPLSCALFVISTHTVLNIMHLFALLILVVVSVDYGIYSAKEGDSPRTAHAIFFSAITTGLSFGILITSNTKALNSFGEVIFTGMACVLFMLVFHRSSRPKSRHRTFIKK